MAKNSIFGKGKTEDSGCKPEPAGKDKTDNDIITGMKAICQFTGYSECTIEKFRREYSDFPVQNNGRLIMSKSGWNKFWSKKMEG